jgi:hypothetical protein
MTDEDKQFLVELQALLSKYNADISFSVGSCSDTHGLYDEKMVISRRLDPKSFKEVDILEVSGWSINAYDLKD